MSSGRDNDLDQTSPSFEPVYVARQPVFNRDMQIWGYELLFRHSQDVNSAYYEDGDIATSKVIADGFGMAEEWLSPNQKVLINYSQSMLLRGSPLALPAELAVVEILETVSPDEEIIRMCRHLKDQGYTLALDDYTGLPGLEPLIELVDIVKVDISGLPAADLVRVVRDLRKFNCILLAEKVGDFKAFDLSRDMGFDLFQGFFFSRPWIMTGKKLNASQLAKLNLINLLGSDDLDLAGIADIIKTDVSLSYRLLRLINSAGMGLAFKIRSISQAVAMLGQQRISTWLQIIILAEINSTPKGQELLFLSLQRARFLESVGNRSPGLPVSSGSMFLMGLFSCLDALLSQPMEEVLKKISLEPRISKALKGKDPELQKWLDLALSCEHGLWMDTARLLRQTGLSSEETALIMNESTVWAKRFLEMS
ncbi:EAL and HDOD domain-containing protein [Desulfonatronovibrio hydrogenovorans]|uniref:EAL and HDOD domain-containing protein n=1 Tax=Desulfonatronovibrio hydrogenovorans TaxID=53245 RepID=UPI000691E2D0|nr:HDOD domain-containing protein [Desulfonatronovibrio hydrogenovorans]